VPSGHDEVRVVRDADDPRLVEQPVDDPVLGGQSGGVSRGRFLACFGRAPFEHDDRLVAGDSASDLEEAARYLTLSRYITMHLSQGPPQILEGLALLDVYLVARPSTRDTPKCSAVRMYFMVKVAKLPVCAM